MGTLKGFTAKIYVDPTAEPRFHPARSVPYALRDLVDKELTHLQEAGTLEISEWAAPIVTVLKGDRSVRICGDFSITVNPVSKLDRYPIPKIEDLFAQLSKGKFYSKIDLSHAYQQLLLDDDSKMYIVINTHKGLFHYTCLPFGISSAPGIFQRVMESILQGVSGVVVYLDDILISGSTEDQHLAALDEVLSRMDKSELRGANVSFADVSVSYLGHRIDAQDLHPLPERICAIRDAPAPTSVSALKSHLGMLTYYSKFLPNLSTLLHPLYKLLHKDIAWHWGQEQEKAFSASKELMMSDSCLTHFDSTLELTLACDASAYSLGAVLLHRRSDGIERLIDFPGPLEGKFILIIIDTHSKWIEAVATSSTSSKAVIEHLRTPFAQFSILESIVTDNGTGFVSEEFQSFLKTNGVRHTTSPPYHPSSNGLAECAVQIVKKGLRKITSGSMSTRLAEVLFSYRITPQGTTGLAPAELLLGWCPRTRLDLLRLTTADRVEGKQC